MRAAPMRTRDIHHSKDTRTFFLIILLTSVLMFCFSPDMKAFPDQHTQKKKRHPTISVESFFQAVETGNRKKVKQYLKQGFDPNAKRSDGVTPLMVAVSRGYEDIVDILIKAGVNVNQQDHAGRTALMLASARGYTNIVRKLLEHKADPNLISRGCLSSPAFQVCYPAILWAGIKGYRNIVRLLVKYGARLDLKVGFQNVPMTWILLERQREDMIPLFLELGADPNMKGPFGMTLLMKAIERGQPDLVRLLIQAGADVCEPDHVGKLPIEFARARGFHHIVRILESHGGTVENCRKKKTSHISKDEPVSYTHFTSYRNGPQSFHTSSTGVETPVLS